MTDLKDKIRWLKNDTDETINLSEILLENAKLKAENDRIKNVVRVHAERMADAGYIFEAEGLLEDVNRKGAIER